MQMQQFMLTLINVVFIWAYDIKDKILGLNKIIICLEHIVCSFQIIYLYSVASHNEESPVRKSIDASALVRDTASNCSFEIRPVPLMLLRGKIHFSVNRNAAHRLNPLLSNWIDPIKPPW